MKFFTPNMFLKVGGAVLLLVGILGFIGVIGPTPEKSIFGATWWFDNAENWAHTVLGIAGLASAFVLPANLQKYLVITLGVVGVVVGVYGFVTPMLLGANLENPADDILHLGVGAWAFASAMSKAATAKSDK